MRDTNNNEEERTSYLKPGLYVRVEREREIERKRRDTNNSEEERKSYLKPSLYVWVERERERE